MNHKIVFMGSPEFAVPTLSALSANYRVVGVVTQPDRPAGRGRKLKPSAVKTLAEDLSIPTLQPKRLSQSEAIEQLRVWNPDIIVVAAFGQILQPELLNLPAKGCINMHASLLPRWRGAAPIQAAISNGDTQTGVTIMVMDAGLDTGPILSQRVTPIPDDDTAGELSARMAQIGSELLLETLPGYITGDIRPIPQDSKHATYAPSIKKREGELDFSMPAIKLERVVRAFNPWPGAYINWVGGRIIIHKASVETTKNLGSIIQPGVHTIYQKTPAIGTSEGLLVLEEVQPAGKKSMQGKVFLSGARDWLHESPNKTV